MTSEQQPFYIGRYLVTGKLGAGGMGVVYLATDERLNRKVAIKRLHSNPNSSNAHKRIRQEALLLAQLNHSNIVQIYDVVDDNDDIALVMEYVDGNSLQQWQRERTPNTLQKIRLLKQICSGLTRAHGAGIVHRDLKAENILIDSSNTVKISDFGIAKNWLEDSEITREQHVAGSWSAMSPEQALGKPLDNRSDLFALGVLAYQLLCEQNPFGNHESPFVIVDRIVNNQHPPAAKLTPDLPPALCRLLDQLLAKDPDQRPINAASVAAELDAISYGLMSEYHNNHSGSRTASGSATGSTASSSSHSATRTVTITAEQYFQQQPLKQSLPQPSRTRRLLIAAAAGCGLLLCSALVLWMLPTKTQHHSGKYIAVIAPPDQPESVSREQRLLTNNVLSAIKQGLSNREGLLLIPYSESQKLRGIPLRQQAQALNAQLLLSPGVTCDDNQCSLSLELIDTKNFAVIANRSTRLAPDESLESRARTLQQLKYLLPVYPSRGDDDSIAINANDYQRYLELYERRYDYRNMGDTLDALDDLQRHAPDFPPLYELYGNLSIDLEKNTRDAEAVNRLEKLLLKVPSKLDDAPEIIATELQLAIKRDDPGRAEALLAQLKLSLPDQANYYHLSATYHHERGDYDKALQSINRALDQRTSYAYLTQKALTLTITGDMPAAKQVLMQAMQLNDNTIDAISLLAGNELDSGNPKETIRLLTTAGLERIGPMDTYNLCLAYYIQKNYNNAQQCFAKVSQLAPADADPLLYRAEIAREQDQLSRAQDFAQRALELTSERKDWEGLLMRARAFAELGNAERAIETLLKIRRDAPDDLYVNYARSQIYISTGDLLSAKAHIRKTLAQGISTIWYRTPQFAKICRLSEFDDLRRKHPGLCGGTSDDNPATQMARNSGDSVNLW